MDYMYVIYELLPQHKDVSIKPKLVKGWSKFLFYSSKMNGDGRVSCREGWVRSDWVDLIYDSVPTPIPVSPDPDTPSPPISNVLGEGGEGTRRNLPLSLETQVPILLL